MSTATTYTASVPPPPLEVAGPVTRVPSLDEIRDLTSVPDRRVVFRGVDWSFYERLVDSIPESSNIHVDYDGKDLEIMGIGPNHEDVKTLLGRFVNLLAAHSRRPCKCLGSTTWKRREIARGVEADQCFYFDADKLATVARLGRSNDVSAFPNPDLAIEVDLSQPQVDRAGIYAALRVAEVWRYGADGLVIERLTADGRYEQVESSAFLNVRPDEIVRWIIQEDTTDDSAWTRRLWDWAAARAKQETAK